MNRLSLIPFSHLHQTAGHIYVIFIPITIRSSDYFAFLSLPYSYLYFIISFCIHLNRITQHMKTMQNVNKPLQISWLFLGLPYGSLALKCPRVIKFGIVVLVFLSAGLFLFMYLETINMVLVIINNKVKESLRAHYTLELYKIEWAAFRKEFLEMSQLKLYACFLLFSHHIFIKHLMTLSRCVCKVFHTGEWDWTQ